MPPTTDSPSDDAPDESHAGVDPRPVTRGLVVTGASRWPWYDDHEHHDDRD